MIWENYIKGWSNAFNFSGIATRYEWWTFFLINNLLVFALALFVGPEGDGVVAILQLVMLIPTVSVAVRRVRDIGISGWWTLLILPLGIPMLIVAFIPTSAKVSGFESQKPEPKASPELKDFHYTPEQKTASNQGADSSSRPAARLPLKDFN